MFRGRIGNPVKIGNGPAAVTGTSLLQCPASESDERQKKRGKPESQKTCLDMEGTDNPTDHGAALGSILE